MSEMFQAMPTRKEGWEGNIVWKPVMQLWASACGDWQWMVRHITLSFVMGWWCHLQKRWSGGFFREAGLTCSNVQKIRRGKKRRKKEEKKKEKKRRGGKKKKKMNSWRFCDVYINIFQQLKSTCKVALQGTLMRLWYHAHIFCTVLLL